MRAFIVLVFLTGCSHSAVVVSNAHPVVPSSNVNATGAVAAAVLITTVAIAASQGGSAESSAPTSSMSSAWTSQPVPGMAPEREVGEQDCTRPIDLTAGNLRCR